jgi:hypothetical protein
MLEDKYDKNIKQHQEPTTNTSLALTASHLHLKNNQLAL